MKKKQVEPEELGAFSQMAKQQSIHATTKLEPLPEIFSPQEAYSTEATSALTRMQGMKLGSSPFEEWARFDIGSVIVREIEDLNVSYHDFNLCGLAIIEGSLRLLVESKCAPTWLVYPAGTLFCKMSREDAEREAAELVSALLHTRTDVSNLIETLHQQGMQGMFLGVDDTNGYQVPVYVQALSNDIAVIPLARRGDRQNYLKPYAPPSKYAGSRYIAGSPSVYISYCGEISQTSSGGVVNGFRMGSGEIDYVLDLSHYFYPTGRPLSGIWNFVGKAMGRAAASDRLDAPVIASTVLVNRRICVNPQAAPTALWFAVRRHAWDLGKDGDARCLRPKSIVWGGVGTRQQDVSLAINLFA